MMYPSPGRHRPSHLPVCAEVEPCVVASGAIIPEQRGAPRIAKKRPGILGPGNPARGEGPQEKQEYPQGVVRLAHVPATNPARRGKSSGPILGGRWAAVLYNRRFPAPTGAEGVPRRHPHNIWSRVHVIKAERLFELLSGSW
jgi:hypothetical protein